MKEIDKLNFRPFTRFCMSIGAVPSSYLAGLTIEEQLLWLCSYLEKEVIPAVNNNAEAVEELQGLFIELKSYVDNYFDNLDVQEEINNKLDDMVESGELQEIVASYLQTRAVFGFDTVADMKDGENLIAGSYARTLGYYSINDEGGALYHIRNITNDDVIDEMFIIEMNDSQNQLIAELIPENNQISLKQLGLLGDGTTDETTKLQKAFASNYDIFVNNGTYVTNVRISITSPKKVHGDKNASIKAKKDMSIFTNVMYVDSNNVEITDLIFDGNITENPIGDIYNASQGYTLLELHNTSNLIVKNCIFKDNAYGAIRLGGTYANETDVKNIIITENYFTDVDCGFISMASNSNMNLIDTKIINNIFDGQEYSEPISIFHTGKTENLLIDNNIIKNKYRGHAIYIGRGTGKNIIITNNEIEKCAAGPEVHDTTNLNISNNTIIGNSEHPINSGIVLDTCTNFTVNNNIVDYVSYIGANIKDCVDGNITDNKFYHLNSQSDASSKSAILVDSITNVYFHNNYAKRQGTTNTQLYYLKGSLSYLVIEEMNNTSDVECGMQTMEISSLTNANIRTNLSMNGNFTSSNVSSNTNRITQYNPTTPQSLSLPYRFKFAKEVPIQMGSNATFSTFTIYNLVDNDVYTLNIRVIGGATITLTNDTVSDFGITWKTTRSITTHTQLKLMYYNGKMYEV